MPPPAGFCPRVMSPLAPSPRWEAAAAHRRRPEKPLVNGPSRNPGVGSGVATEAKANSHFRGNISLTQDGMCHFPPVGAGLTTWPRACRGHPPSDHYAGSSGAGLVTSDEQPKLCSVHPLPCCLPLQGIRKERAVFDARHISSPLSLQSTLRFLAYDQLAGHGPLYLNRLFRSWHLEAHCYPTPTGTHSHLHPQHQSFQTSSSLQGVKRP